MNKITVLLGVTFCLALLPASIPLDSIPSWSSNSNDFSTGGGFWDIDTNGYIDFCMSNGNDMAYDHNAVYFNSSGTLESIASWRSADAGEYGHLYLGDIDNDGLMDMAVATLGGDDRRPEIYRNSGGTLGLSLCWRAADTTTHFDCCLGDVNLDGYLDLAIAAGDAYSGRAEPLKIYMNRAGTFDTLPAWQSANRVVVDAVRFADLDNDGRLDLIADGKGYVYVFYQRGDTLERNPSWVDTLNANTYGLRLAVGDYDNDGRLDLAAVQNGQNSAGNCIRIYHNDLGTLAKPPQYILQRSDNCSSCVAWGDVNNDGYLDLAAGGWWEPVVVYENHTGALDTLPGWSWLPADPSKLVCESVLWGDVRNSHLVPTDETASGDSTRKLFRVRHIPFQSFSGIDVTGTPVPRSDYCFDPLTGYVALRDAPPNDTDNVVFHYTYSAYPDLAITNWEHTDRNYVFYNSTPPQGVECSADPVRARLDISSMFGSSDLRLNVVLPDHITGTVAVFTVSGRKAATIAQGLGSGCHILNWSSGNSLTKGVYFIRLSCSDGSVLSCKTIRIR